MSEYRRYYVPGGLVFFTVVTFRRRPILTGPLGRRCLREAIAAVRARRPFEILALVLLPDHLHTIWALPRGDAAYSVRWRRIKEEFTERYLAGGGSGGRRSLAFGRTILGARGSLAPGPHLTRFRENPR